MHTKGIRNTVEKADDTMFQITHTATVNGVATVFDKQREENIIIMGHLHCMKRQSTHLSKTPSDRIINY